MTIKVQRRSRRGAERRDFKFDFKSVSEAGEFEGYASIFGVPDQANDVIVPGAFRRSLRQRGPEGVKMLYQHLPYEPIGVWRAIAEDAKGLRVSGTLLPDVARAREVLALMRAGAIDGLSIGFRTVRGRTDDKTGFRTLYEVDLWEISVVTFPMLADARVTAVKQFDNPLARVLRTAAGRLRQAST